MIRARSRFWAALPIAFGIGACTSDGKTPHSDGPSALGPPTSVVPARDALALQEGNRGARCDDSDLDARVDALLAKMTLEQKVHEMHGDDQQRVVMSAINGFYQAGGDPALGIPIFKMVDGARGVRTGASVSSEGTATAFPVAMARGATFDPELERRVGLAIGREVAAKGGNVLLAPTINMLRHPAWGRAQETYSEDPEHMSEMATAFIGGAQNHVLATAKHFALNSIEDTRFTVSANVDERTLREIYLPHFHRAVAEAHVASLMAAYNRVNDTYCAENPHLLSDILKGDWGFTGFVMSDWIVATRSTLPSLKAGLDLEMPVGIFYGDPLLEAVRTGAIDESALDGAVRRILRAKLCFDLNDPPPLDPSAVENPEHVALAREVAEKGIVLLRNENSVLPLPAERGSIAVVGALAAVANLGDHGSSFVIPSYAVTPLDGIRGAANGADVVAVPTDTPSAEELERVASADVAIVVAGLTFTEEGEFIPVANALPGRARGGDRVDLDLLDVHEQLIATVAAKAKHTVVVLEAGSALTVRKWVDAVDAVVMAWYPGMEGGNALAHVLFGTVNPSGKLPVTFPRALGDLPPFDVTVDEVEYGYFHGYRLLDRNEVAPEFPFGFGLSYTTFALDRLTLDRTSAAAHDVVTVRVDVGNVGERAGDEVVQLYAGYPSSSVERAKHALRAFRRVSLESGEVKTVEFTIAVSDLAYYDVTRSAWVVEPGDVELSAGTSSRDLPLRAVLRVE